MIISGYSGQPTPQNSISYLGLLLSVKAGTQFVRVYVCVCVRACVRKIPAKMSDKIAVGRKLLRYLADIQRNSQPFIFNIQTSDKQPVALECFLTH
jgi:hypothetical protein